MPDHIHVNDVKYTRGRVTDELLVREGDLRVKLMKYKKGDEIPMHRHSDPKHEKLLVEGKVKFIDDDGAEITLDEGAMYMCGSGALYYSGSILEDTIIMVIESSDSVLDLKE